MMPIHQPRPRICLGDLSPPDCCRLEDVSLAPFKWNGVDTVRLGILIGRDMGADFIGAEAGAGVQYVGGGWGCVGAAPVIHVVKGGTVTMMKLVLVRLH